ncbi:MULTISPECIES: MSMEG_0565 family glycosyltransferase [unclassified Pannonibacter]|uniref:MSMEG_0565 family glycosyltransferase n=1 Tax=unclassified Pannonibacter TaxID=2627228 RepID=UPI0016467286|nr:MULTISPECIES: MSMEG_0565 family glycosyltransferase [unclassified Pannonibacter]
MSRSLRIAMLTHSTNPRGGVVHAMQVSEALAALGHQVTLFAPDASGKGFFRQPKVRMEAFAVPQAPAGMTDMVEQRIRDYTAFFRQRGTDGFDLFHAHDGISGNALADLAACGQIAGFLRTVHHLDEFADPRLMALQARSIAAADALFTVSRHWTDDLARRGLSATCTGNGVDCQRFRPGRAADDGAGLAARLGVSGGGPVFLAIGGVEARKNTLNILLAFAEARAVLPSARLVIAGGVSLLDHHDYQAAFKAALAARPELSGAVHMIGAVADEDMPQLYRMADVLVFASVKEGFGLAVLEAMASGLPVVLSAISPFTEYVPEAAALWCDPHSPSSIAGAMLTALRPEVAAHCTAAGFTVAAAHDWHRAAVAHLPVYLASLAEREPANA